MKLNLYDKDLNRIAIIGNQYISCLWSEGYNTTENFVVELNATDEYKKKVKPDCYVGRSDRKTLMVIKSIKFENGKVIASGKQATRVLDDVAFIGTLNSGSLIDTSVKTAYNSSTKYRNVEFADTALGVSYGHEISNKSFLKLCETMAQETDVGIKSVREGKTISVSFYKPSVNPNLVFSENFGNLMVEVISVSTEKLKNYAIVLGEGEGENRKKVIVDASNGAEKRELIVDASGEQKQEEETDESYNERLSAIGVEKLLENREIFSCSFIPHTKDFGTKYDLGDVLTIYLTDYGLTLRARVARFTQKSQNNKTETSVEVGNITIKR